MRTSPEDQLRLNNQLGPTGNGISAAHKLERWYGVARRQPGQRARIFEKRGAGASAAEGVLESEIGVNY